MNRQNLQRYAAQRNMNLPDYQVWLDEQVAAIDFDSDQIPHDVATYAAYTFGAMEVTAEEMAEMEQAEGGDDE